MGKYEGLGYVSRPPSPHPGAELGGKEAEILNKRREGLGALAALHAVPHHPIPAPTQLGKERGLGWWGTAVISAQRWSVGVSLSVKNRMKLYAPPLAFFNLQHSLCLKLYGQNLQAKNPHPSPHPARKGKGAGMGDGLAL